MTVEVVDAHQGKIACEGYGFCEGQPDEKRSGEAGPLRDGDGVYPGKVASRLLERSAHDRIDHLDVASRGQLRHDASVEAVNIHLRGDAVGKDAGPVLDDGRGGLVAGSLDSEDAHSMGL